MPEVISVLNRHRNAGRLSQSTFNAAYSYLAADSRLIKLLPVRNYQIDSSIRLLLKHNLNATDALHLQVALDLHARFQQEHHKVLLLCADQRLLRAAQSEGLTVLNPETDTLAQVEALLA
jgi:predicted nucleic acid-binding protein